MFQPQAPTELAGVHRKSHFTAWVRLWPPCHDAFQARGLFIEGTVFGFIESITNAGHWPHVVQSMFISTCSAIREFELIFANCNSRLLVVSINEYLKSVCSLAVSIMPVATKP